MGCVIALSLALVAFAGCAGSPDSTTTRSGPPNAAVLVQTTAFSVRNPGQLPEKLTIPLQNQRGYLLAPARIDGQPAGQFMFDTGSNLAVISTGLAGRLGLAASGASQAVGVGGKQPFEYRTFNRLEFGGLELASQRAAAISLHPMSQGIGASVSGLVGVRDLGGLPFTLDYGDATLTIYRPDSFNPPTGVTPERARFDFAGLPVVSAEIGQGHLIWLILDSGADNELTLPTKCLELWPDIMSVPGTGSGHSAGIGGTVPSTYTWLGRLKVFGLELRDMPVQFEQAPESFDRQPRPVGRIGGAFLKNFRLTMDPKRNLIWAQWLPGEREHEANSTSGKRAASPDSR